MHALIKSEAYYLINDPVIKKWESRVSLRKCAENMFMRLQYTGKAYTNIFTITMRENTAIVNVCGKTFNVSKGFICANIERMLEIQHDYKAFQKLLAAYTGK